MSMMETRRWINQSQPQTLYFAVILMYIDAAFALLFGGIIGIGLLLVAGYVASGYGISNERKWGYILGLVMAGVGLAPYVLFFISNGRLATGALLGLMFAIAKLALLLHPQSREYQRIWFK